MRFQQLAQNLYLSDDSRFGDYNPTVIRDILMSVDINFSMRLNRPPFSSKACYITYTPGDPMCCSHESGHIIRLDVSGNFWCQWAYQFAHEYCHHLIDGPLTGEISGLMWLEETVCELSSMYHLHRLNIEWPIRGQEHLRHWAPAFRDYLDGLLLKNQPLFALTTHPGWLQSWIPTLSEPEYHRDRYNAIAAAMFPLFVENPALWKIILYFGDMRRWHSLDELFAHLRATADDSYAASLQKLHDLLFS